MTPSGTEDPTPISADRAAAPSSTPATPDSADEQTVPIAAAAAPAAPTTVRAPTTDRHQVEDYGTTRLVNFRLPVDLHDRYKRLVREVETSDPKLRRPSLTEVVIALLSEGPSTPQDVAQLIRRKRAAEHGAEL